MRSYKEILKDEIIMKNRYDGWTATGMEEKLKEIEIKENKVSGESDFYILQHDGCRLGNFIQTTPLIRALYENNKSRGNNSKIPVLFQTEYVKQCYIKSPYIEPISSPKGKLLYSTLNLSKNNIKDSQYIQKIVLGYTTEYKPFIDEYKNFSGNYGVFINGSGSENPSYLDRKLVDKTFQQVIQDNSPIPVIGLGSLEDKKRNIFPGVYGDIHLALDIINGAKWVITNATGFFHVAGALNKTQLALWKDCQRPRNENLNELCTYSSKGNWESDIINFLNVNK